MTLDYDEFLAKVQRDAALPGQDDAVRAIRAALATLARRLPEPVRPWLHEGAVAAPFGVEEYLEALSERLSAGAAEDLAARVAEELAERLRRGEQRTKGRPASLDVEAFVERTAQLEGVAPDRVRPCR